MVSTSNNAYHNQFCRDEDVNIKCMLLDIEIWQNFTEGCKDIARGQWYIVQVRGNNRRYYWGPNNPEGDCVPFDSPQAALDAYIRGNKDFGFW